MQANTTFSELHITTNQSFPLPCPPFYPLLPGSPPSSGTLTLALSLIGHFAPHGAEGCRSGACWDSWRFFWHSHPHKALGIPQFGWLAAATAPGQTDMLRTWRSVCHPGGLFLHLYQGDLFRGVVTSSSLGSESEGGSQGFMVVSSIACSCSGIMNNCFLYLKYLYPVFLPENRPLGQLTKQFKESIIMKGAWKQWIFKH